jgi:signal transduction histidine kinase
MNKSVQKLTREYSVALKKFLNDEHESLLERAYCVGRDAIASGLGVLDVASIHQQALGARSSENAWTFFWEALSPFEVTHRGFREANARLQQLIEALEKRNSELAKVNRELHREIAQRKRTENALRQSEENLRRLSTEILHAQEEERKRISRELHDEVGQSLTVINMTLTAMKNNGAGKSPAIAKKIGDAQRLLNQTMETVHGFARELRPAMLDELGLVPALRSHLKSFARRTGLRVQFSVRGLVDGLSPEQKTVLYRVAQESLTNVARHAKAERVEVAIRRGQIGICMTISDNGRSFHYDPKATKRLGLLGMQERVRLVNGEFTLKAEPGKGTTIRVELPISSAPTFAPGGNLPH